MANGPLYCPRPISTGVCIHAGLLLGPIWPPTSRGARRTMNGRRAVEEIEDLQLQPRELRLEAARCA